MRQTTILIGTLQYLLAQNGDIDKLKAAVLAAIRSGGDYVDFTVVGNRSISVLIPPGVVVVFQSADVDEDDRDTGDLTSPYDELHFLDQE
jgi:hypothetical protein